MLVTIFNVVLYQPLLNGLILLYTYLPGHDFGIAVIILTLLIKFLFYPLGIKALKSQKAMAEIQPKIKELQKKYKDDKEKQTMEIMALYKEAKMNPFSGCFPILIQLPVLIALYRVFWRGLQLDQIAPHLYSFVPKLESINTSFLGLIDLSQSATMVIDNVRHYLWPNIILIFLVGALQFVQAKLTMGRTKTGNDFSGQVQKQMLYFMPAFMIMILINLPSAIALYFLTSTLFTIGQQYVIMRNHGSDKPTTDKGIN